MKMFKKTAAFLLAAAVALSLCACGQAPAMQTPDKKRDASFRRCIPLIYPLLGDAYSPAAFDSPGCKQ